MKIVFHNPHTIWFKTNLPCYNAKVKSISKYNYLFDYLYLKNEKITVLINNFSDAPVFTGILRKFNTPKVEFYAWVLLNRLNPFRFNVISNSKKLKEDDVLFSFLYGHFTNLPGIFKTSRDLMIDDFKDAKAYKVIHLSHYGYNASLGSVNSQKSDIDLFVAESNLSKNSKFFQNFFSWYKDDVYILPYVPEPRFILKTKFTDRVNLVVASGTNTHRMQDVDFISFFNDNRLQPIRTEIVENSLELSRYIDSLITNISLENSSNNKNKGGSQFLKTSLSTIIKLVRFFVIDFFKAIDLLLHTISKYKKVKIKNDRDYYKLNIVDKYNQYKMFIVPEEIIGLPAIGFVEGMACGCAYIGLNDPMYADLGMKDREHYIGYDGTLKDLIAKISYYQDNNDELERIALNGYFFVKEKFNQEKVVTDFLNYLKLKTKSRIDKND